MPHDHILNLIDKNLMCFFRIIRIYYVLRHNKLKVNDYER